MFTEKPTTEAETRFCSKSYGYPKVGDLYGSWHCSGFVLVIGGFTKDCMHGSGRRKEDGPVGVFSLLFLLCFGCVGGNGKQPQHTGCLAPK